MDLSELRTELSTLQSGQWTVISYDQYAILFPAGEPDQIVHTDSYHFAKANACHIENRPSQQEVWIIKNA